MQCGRIASTLLLPISRVTFGRLAFAPKTNNTTIYTNFSPSLWFAEEFMGFLKSMRKSYWKKETREKKKNRRNILCRVFNSACTERIDRIVQVLVCTSASAWMTRSLVKFECKNRIRLYMKRMNTIAASKKNVSNRVRCWTGWGVIQWVQYTFYQEFCTGFMRTTKNELKKNPMKTN